VPSTSANRTTSPCAFSLAAGHGEAIQVPLPGEVEHRRRLLEGVGLTLASDLGVAGQRAVVDDVLDAAVAAWTAGRVGDDIARPVAARPARGVQ
jgi:hypothetical protein